MTRPVAGSVRAWFPDEIEALLSAVAMANDDVARAIDTPEMLLYRRGFDAALRAVALAVQVQPPAGGKREVTR